MEFEDHGDPSVDERWRRLLSHTSALSRHASQAGAQPLDYGRKLADDPHYAPEDYVPQEFHAEGRTSLAICQAIPNGPQGV
jgi:hypothetical protein